MIWLEYDVAYSLLTIKLMMGYNIIQQKIQNFDNSIWSTLHKKYRRYRSYSGHRELFEKPSWQNGFFSIVQCTCTIHLWSKQCNSCAKSHARTWFCCCKCLTAPGCTLYLHLDCSILDCTTLIRRRIVKVSE